jgi:hypothetical protein
MKKQIIILIFALIGAAATHTTQAETYDPLAVQRINDLIANNNLYATPNAPETWEGFATWNDETPKKIVELELESYCLYMPCGNHTGSASFAGLTTLQRLGLERNRLTKIDVTNCTQLQTLNCEGNRYLSELDLTGCIELQSLNCADNALLNLDLAKLDKLTEFNGSWQNVDLTLFKNEAGEYTLSIFLNDPAFENSAISYSDGILKSTDKTVRGTYFSVQTNKKGFELTGSMWLSYSDEVGIDSPESMQLKIYPNPTTGELKVESGELKVEHIDIYDVKGRKQLSTFNFQLSTEIDISHLPAGVYVVKVMTEQGGITKKIIKR